MRDYESILNEVMQNLIKEKTLYSYKTIIEELESLGKLETDKDKIVISLWDSDKISDKFIAKYFGIEFPIPEKPEEK